MPAADVGLEADLDLPLNWTTSMISRRELIQQRVRIALSTHLGDFILDKTKGLPFILWIDTKPAPALAVLSRVVEVLLEIPGIARVEDAVSSFAVATGRITVNATIVTEEDLAIPTTVQVGGSHQFSYPPIAIYFNPVGTIVSGGVGI